MNNKATILLKSLLFAVSCREPKTFDLRKVLTDFAVGIFPPQEVMDEVEKYFSSLKAPFGDYQAIAKSMRTLPWDQRVFNHAWYGTEWPSLPNFWHNRRAFREKKNGGNIKFISADWVYPALVRDEGIDPKSGKPKPFLVIKYWPLKQNGKGLSCSADTTFNIPVMSFARQIKVGQCIAVHHRIPVDILTGKECSELRQRNEELVAWINAETKKGA
jgi:hypothetical protein